MSQIVKFERKSFCAKLHTVMASGMEINTAGTLDGFIDFSVTSRCGNQIIYQITCDDARNIIAALHGVVADIQANCLFDRDPLLMPEIPHP